jgi:hypothetical protein
VPAKRGNIVIAVVASRHDPRARALVDGWRPHGAALLSCEDLSVRGWRYEVGRPCDATAIVEGQAVPSAAIRGVVTLRPFVFAPELVHVAPVDREYVAAEETAFLFAWLSSLSCPMLNRPVGSSLSGPAWARARWMHEARASGFSIDPAPDPHDAFAVCVIGPRCIGSSDPRVVRPALSLARAAGVDWLRLSLVNGVDGPRFVGADAIPDPSSPELLENALDFFGVRRP